MNIFKVFPRTSRLSSALEEKKTIKIFSPFFRPKLAEHIADREIASAALGSNQCFLFLYFVYVFSYNVRNINAQSIFYVLAVSSRTR